MPKKKRALSWPKRYCLWRIDRHGTPNYRQYFDTLGECVTCRNLHLSESVEFEDSHGEGGNVGKGIWYFSPNQLAGQIGQ